MPSPMATDHIVAKRTAAAGTARVRARPRTGPQLYPRGRPESVFRRPRPIAEQIVPIQCSTVEQKHQGVSRVVVTAHSRRHGRNLDALKQMPPKSHAVLDVLTVLIGAACLQQPLTREVALAAGRLSGPPCLTNPARKLRPQLLAQIFPRPKAPVRGQGPTISSSMMKSICRRFALRELFRDSTIDCVLEQPSERSKSYRAVRKDAVTTVQFVTPPAESSLCTTNCPRGCSG